MAGAIGTQGLTESGPLGREWERGRNLAGGDEKEEKPEATARSPQGRQPLQAAVVTMTVLQVDTAG